MVIVLNTLMIMNVYCRYLSRNRNTQETQLFLSEQDVNLHVRHFVLTPRKKIIKQSCQTLEKPQQIINIIKSVAKTH